MASLWTMLREEVRGTVDDFRQKGALGALRDAALDTKDLALDAGGWLVSGVKDLVNVNEDGEGIVEAYVVGPDVPKRGSTCMLCLPDGNLVEATAVDVDGVSEPPRARVVIPGVDQPMLVPILEPGAAREAMNIEAEKSAGGDASLDLFTGLKEELNSTVQEFRQKGAVGALRDAALDAVDLVGSTANSAVSGARSFAEPAVQDFREKGAVGAVKDAALDAVDILGNTAMSAVSGAKSMASPLIDLVSDQPEGEQQPTASEEREGSAAASSAPPAGDGSQQRGSLLDELKQEWNETVNDFREKGAVGAVKDVALDAVDLVGSTATTAFDAASTVVKGARARAAPLLTGSLPDLWAEAGASDGTAMPEAAAAAPAASSSSVPGAAGPTADNSQAKPPSPSKPAAVFSPPARSSASTAAPAQTPKSPEDRRTSAAAPPSPSSAAESAATASVAAPPKVKEPVPESEMPNGKTGRPSLVSMRRGMFEKPKAQEDSKKDADEAQGSTKEAEELID